MSYHDPLAPNVEPQNPEPANTTGLDSGGGVPIGDTPPAESGVGGPQHEPPQRSLALPIIALTVIGLIAVAIAVGLLGRIAGFL